MRKIEVCGYNVTIADTGETVTASIGAERCQIDRELYLEAMDPDLWGGDDNGQQLADLTHRALAACGILTQDEAGEWRTDDDHDEARSWVDNDAAERRAYYRTRR